MPRPRGFRNNTTLSRAMRVFWQQGYDQTSVRDLELATGLNASSLYNAWGGKEALFRQVLDYYVEGIVQRRIETYLQKGDPIRGIRRFFETTYEYIDPGSIFSRIEVGDLQGEVVWQCCLREGARFPPIHPYSIIV